MYSAVSEENSGNISLDSFRNLLQNKIPSAGCTASSLSESAGHPNCFTINPLGNDAANSLTVSMSVDRTPEVFMYQHDAKDTISCCYSSNILEKLFQVKSQPWRFLLQNINWSKVRILDDFLHPNLPVYEELSSLIVESGDSHSPICNVSFVTGNNTLSVHFDFRSRLSTFKCTLQIDQYKSVRVSIHAVDVHEKYKPFVDFSPSRPFDVRQDRLSSYVSAYATQLERKVATLERTWGQVFILFNTLRTNFPLQLADYTAFCMPVHLTVKSGERSFISIAVRSDEPPTGDSYRVTLMLRRFRSAHIARRDFFPNQLTEIHDYVTKQLKIPPY